MRWISVLTMAVLLGAPQWAFGQAAGTISGTVTGTGGRPLAGASVAVAGTTRGSQTDAQGRFSITAVPAGGRTVRATFAGYTEQTRTVTVSAGQTSTMDITLTAQALTLEGVVATGYATQRRQDVTGSVVSLQTQNIEQMPVTSATQALAGQIPGVSVITPSGAPGAGAQIQIRGVTAVGAGSVPLYVVDGFPITASSATGSATGSQRELGTQTGGQNQFTMFNPLNDIPPSDIESITVLKDASAAAIYGSRAANGVVIITTKRGRSGATPAIDISAYTGMQSVDYSRLPQLANGREFAVYENRRYRQLGQAIPVEFQNPDQYIGNDTDWLRQVLRSAPTQNANISISGGSERIRSYIAGGFLNQDGVLLNTGYRRYNIRANLETDLGSHFQVGVNLAPTYSIRNLRDAGGVNNPRVGGLGEPVSAWPIDAARDANGDPIPLVRGSVNGRALTNPILTNTLRKSDQRTMRTLGSAFANYKILEGLTFRSTFNVDWADTDDNQFDPSTLPTLTGPTIPRATVATSTYLSWLSENTLTLDRQIGDAHRFQILGGFTSQREKTTGQSLLADRYPDDDVQTINAAQVVTPNSVTDEQWSLASVLGRVNYTLLDRYVLTATVRSDGSSRFGEANRWGTFPSAAIAWNVSREPFMENTSFVEDLKLRASLGYTGNNQIGNYPSLGVIAGANYILGGAVSPGRAQTTLKNPSLGWERTREINLGTDMFFLAHRVGLTVDAYRRTTQDLLLALELPQVSGFGSIVANQGKIQNQGLEVGLNTTNISGRTFNWTTSFNVSANRNKALDLGASDTLRSGASLEGSNTHITIVGQPVARFMGYRIVGVYSKADIANACVAGAVKPGCVPVFSGAREGDPHYQDTNGNGVVEKGLDFDIIGSPYPDFTWGFTNNLSYGPLELRVNIDGQVGGQRMNRFLASTENIDGLFNVSKEYAQNMWVSADSTGNGKTPAAGASAAGRVMFRDVSDRWIENADFLWVRNVNLRYSLPSRLTFGARRASVYTSIQNALIFSAFRGNPQPQSQALQSANGSPTSPNLSPGVDNFSYPQTRILTLGIDLGL
jgi:TonB-linked SusC/RagA family outer membrane protein